MAEAIGFAASIIGVIQLAGQVASLSWGYIGGVRGASKNIRDLASEISGLSSVLALILDHADKNSGKSTALGMLNGEKGPIQKCTEELEKLQAKLKLRDGVRGAFDSLTWPLKESETLQCISRIQRLKGLFNLALTADISTVSNAIHEYTQETLVAVQRIEESVRDTSLVFQAESAAQSARRQKEELQRREEKRKKVLGWVYSGDYDTRHIEINNILQKGTGGWLLKRPEVQGWARGEGRRLLWGRGHPGSGKTYLSAVIINHFQSQAQAQAQEERHGVAYIYFNYKEQESQKPIQVLRILIRQLADEISHLPTKLGELYNKQEKNMTKPTIDELYIALLEVSRSFPQVFFVFDALDECHRDTQRRELLPLFRRMAKDGICVFVTSRPHPEDVQDALEDVAKIRLFAQDEDIATYIKEKIEMNPRAKKLAQDEKDRIVSRLKEYAKGMFLLVRFHIEYLCQQTSGGQILEALEDLRTSSNTRNGALNFAYGRAVENIKSQDKSSGDLAIKILSWLLKARRTLTVEELLIAVSVGPGCRKLEKRDLPGNETLIDVCHGLVTIDKDTIRLAHHTVLEYLQQNPLIPTDEFDLARTCITYLSFDTLGGGACASAEAMKDRLISHPFLDYAASHLDSHLKECEESSTTGMYLEFIKDSNRISSWLQFLSYRDRYGSDVYLKDRSRRPLHIASSLGHLSVVQLLVEDGADISSQDDAGDTALHDAAGGGHKVVVELLLAKATSVDIAAQNKDGLTALHCAAKAVHWAAKGGHKAVVGLLLNKGADISSQDKNGDTALHHAATGGHEVVVRLLLGEGADISTRNTHGLTALHQAAGRGHKTVVGLLLEKGADISSQGKSGDTALHHAATGGYEAVVRLLLDEEIDITIRNNGGETALHRAVVGGHEAVVGLLLDDGADISTQDISGYTALHHAADRGHEAVARLLLNKTTPEDIATQCGDKETALHRAAGKGHEVVVGLLLEEMTPAGIATRNNSGYTALHQAAKGGHEAVIRLLLGKGAGIAIQNNDGNTPLHDAVSNEHEAVVELLLGNATLADTATQNNSGYTALHQAAKGGHEAILELLLGKGAGIATQDNDGNTPLHDAVSNGHEAVVELLLGQATPTDIATRNNSGFTALHQAAKGGHEAMLGLLLGKGAGIAAQDNDGNTPLHDAVSNGHEAVVELLLGQATPTDIAARSNSGYTALHQAARGGSRAILKLLLDKGAGIATRGRDGNTPLHDAAHRGPEGEAVFELLLEKATLINIETRNNRGSTVIHRAAEEGSEAIVKLLLDKGANVLALSNYGLTALHLAAAGGYEALTKLLLNKGADTSPRDDTGYTALHYAVILEHDVVIEQLLNKGADILPQDNNGYTALHYAAKGGHETMARLLLDKATPVAISSKDNDGYTALHYAAKRGYEAVVELLLSKATPADISSQTNDGYTALHYAAEGGRETMVRLLLDKVTPADISSQTNDGYTALHYAVKGGYETMVELLLDKATPADISPQDGNGYSALHYAAERGHETMVRLLLDKATPANISSQTNDGYTALVFAAQAGHKTIAELLLDKGANISTPNYHKDTALQWAAYRGHEAVVRLLLSRGADTLPGDNDGDTALHYTILGGDLEDICKLLLDNGADISVLNNKGQTALDIATERGRKRVVNFLQERVRSFSQGSKVDSLQVSLGEDSVPPVLEEVVTMKATAEVNTQDSSQKQPEPLSVAGLDLTLPPSNPIEHLATSEIPQQQQKEDEQFGDGTEERGYLKFGFRMWKECTKTNVRVFLMGVGLFVCFLYFILIPGSCTLGGGFGYMWRWFKGVVARGFLVGSLGLFTCFVASYLFYDFIYFWEEG